MMQLLKNHRQKVIKSENQQERSENKPSGLAASFEAAEVKKLFFSFLITILSIEGVVFFLCYINLLVNENGVFPWKPYLFASFIAPVAVTFVFGLIVLIFNRFFFNQAPPVVEFQRGVTPIFGVGKGEKIALFFQVIHRLPLLLSLLLLIAATALAYKLDAIVLFMAQVGVSTARYLFFTLIGLLVVSAIGIAVWMILSYRLRQKTLQSGHDYRMQLMEQFGMVLLEDGTMINKEGQVVYQQEDSTSISYHDDVEDVQMIEEIDEKSDS
ncbi:hypothetical protein [uncultured Desulfuromusa sp.]|uniref:hypothetical protein n=1 Tax=uncultured Desulfuromusa sp. TaxID=219183 RepID=UPI002AA77F51|nr:hypothetical protein [uncultured Desulfuromusa sp.]